MASKVKTSQLLGAIVIVAATLVAYIPAMRGGFIWDDPDYVVNNDNLRTLDGLARIWFVPKSSPQYYPLVHTTFWIEYQLWALNPAGFHVTNVLLHITGALLLWKLLSMLEIPGAWLAAAVWALHPMNVESVAWITERKNVLSGVFYFASALAYFKFVETDARRWKWWGVALALFACALLSKTVTAMFPAAILVVIWWKHARIRAHDVVPLIPFLMVGISLALLTAYLETYFVGATGERIAELNLSIAQRILVAGRVVWFYPWKLVWPAPLMFIYPRWEVDPGVWWQWMFPAGAVLLVLILGLNRKRLGRAPIAAVLIYGGTLLPVLGFLNVYPMRFSFVADHFAYLAIVALIALLASMMWQVARGGAAIVLIPLAILTWNRGNIYENVETLWRITKAQNPNSWMVRTNLGHALRDRGAYDEAFAEYQAALELAPNLYDTHTNVGMMLGYWKRDAEALERLQRALELNPHFAPAHYSLGLIYARQDRLDDAERHYRFALDSAPDYPLANHALARILAARGQLDEAIAHLRIAATFAPEDRDIRYDLGVALLLKQSWDEAIHNLEQAVRIDPDFAEGWLQLARAQAGAGRQDEALRSAQRALQLKPELGKP